MKMIVIVLLMTFSTSFVFGELVRLDNAKGASVSFARFSGSSESCSTGGKVITLSDADPAYVQVDFPDKWTITKIVIMAGKTNVNYSETDVKAVWTMYNFAIKTKTPTGTYKDVKVVKNNVCSNLEITDKIKAESLRFQLLPYRDDSPVSFGYMSFQIWGDRGSAPKDSKVKIRTKEDAKKALRLNEITVKEYTDMLKTLP